MRFSDYQKAASITCLPHCFCPSYLRPGLLGESGEISDKIKRLTRGDLRLEKDTISIVVEIGDVLWYSAMWAKYSNVITSDIFLSAHITYPVASVTVKSLEETAACVMYDALSFRAKPVRSKITLLLLSLEILANSLNYNMAQVATINKVKLAKRYLDGAIDGTGDNR